MIFLSLTSASYLCPAEKKKQGLTTILGIKPLFNTGFTDGTEQKSLNSLALNGFSTLDPYYMKYSHIAYGMTQYKNKISSNKTLQ